MGIDPHTTRDHLLRGEVLLEEKRTGDRSAHRCEEREHRRIGERQVLQGIIGPEQPNKP